MAGGVWLNMTRASENSTTAHRSAGAPPSIRAEWEGFEKIHNCDEIFAHMSANTAAVPAVFRSHMSFSAPVHTTKEVLHSRLTWPKLNVTVQTQPGTEEAQCHFFSFGDAGEYPLSLRGIYPTVPYSIYT